jgi:S-DNA-T family DNA segregation ATPase FtsK/SpoIIIE
MHVALGETTDRLIVHMLPGQVLEDYHAQSRKLAEALGAHTLRISRRTHGLLTIELLYRDPLAEQITPTVGPTLLLGQLDSGRELTVDPSEVSHMIVQGSTRSGKSRFLYGLLVQLVERDDVLICGSDVTGLLFRPFSGTRHAELQAAGTRSLEEHAIVLEHLVKIMDDRIAAMPDDLDVFPCSAADPYLYVVLEEFAGLVRVATLADGRRNGPLATRIMAAYGRLIAEGAKAGLRLILISQRADASVVGGFERGQAPVRVSFSVLDKEALRMLHPAVPDDVADAHLTAPASYALVSGPGLPYARLRSPRMGSYGVFRRAIARHQAQEI